MVFKTPRLRLQVTSEPTTKNHGYMTRKGRAGQGTRAHRNMGCGDRSHERATTVTSHPVFEKSLDQPRKHLLHPTDGPDPVRDQGHLRRSCLIQVRLTKPLGFRRLAPR